MYHLLHKNIRITHAFILSTVKATLPVLHQLSALLQPTMEATRNDIKLVYNPSSHFPKAPINVKPEGGGGVEQTTEIWLRQVFPRWGFWSLDLSITNSRREVNHLLLLLLTIICFAQEWGFCYFLSENVKIPTLHVCLTSPTPPPHPPHLRLDIDRYIRKIKSRQSITVKEEISKNKIFWFIFNFFF